MGVCIVSGGLYGVADGPRQGHSRDVFSSSCRDGSELSLRRR